MKTEIKSISHAAISFGVQIYVPSDSKNYVIGCRLVCSECNEPWSLNLTECFICGNINPFLYRCSECGQFSSLTKAKNKCSYCNRTGTLRQECPNPKCLSNTNRKIKDRINKYGGVFKKYSGFRISLQRCLACGSQFHQYQVRRIIVSTLSSENVDKTNVHVDDPGVLYEYSYILFRIEQDNKVKYSCQKLAEYEKQENLFVLYQAYNSLKDVIDKIFSR
jgi:hypothetical protein